MKCHTKSLILSTLILGGLFIINNASALSFESEQDISFTLNPVVKIILSNSNLRINDLAPGSSSDSNIIKITAESNAIAGYTLSSTVGNGTTYNTTNLTHTNGTNTFTNLSSNKASLSNFDSNTWGYSYATCTTVECTNTPSWISGDITETTNPGYNGLPYYDTSEPIKLINTTTPGSSAVQFKFGASTNNTQASGTYSNVINFLGVGKVITTSYTINYNDPSEEATSSTIPTQQTGSSTTGAVTISSTQPQREGFIFKGWCTESTSDDTCNGETVQPGGTLALHTGTSNLNPAVNKTLYAMWGENTPVTIVNATTMQDVESCPESLPVGTSNTLIDSRDGESYTVAKLDDGKCWMTSNLNLAGGTTLTSSDTDMSIEFEQQGLSTELGFQEGNKLPESFDPTDSSTPGGGVIIEPFVPSPAFLYNSNSTICSSTSPCYSYYSWITATLGSSSTLPSLDSNTDAPYSICPKGWHLPNTRDAVDSSSDYRRLMIALGGNDRDSSYHDSSNPTGASIFNRLSTPPYQFQLAGIYRPGSYSSGGENGFYLTSTISSSNSSFVFQISSNAIYSSAPFIASIGVSMSVRCVLNN